MTTAIDSATRRNVDLTTPVAGAKLHRRILETIFWSPLLLLSGIIHVLSQRSLKRLLIAVLILDIPLQWGKHFDYRPEMGSMGALGGFDVSITTVALFGLYIGWFFTERIKGQWPSTIWNLPILAYTGILTLSIFVTHDVELTAFQIFFIAQMLLLYVYLAGNLKARAELIFVLRVLMIGAILESCYIVLLALVGHDFAFMKEIGLGSVMFDPTPSVSFARPGGTVGSPNQTAAYLAMIIVLALVIRRMAVPPSLRRLAVPAALVAGLALIATLSRGGWFELIVSVAILIFARWGRHGASMRSVAFIAVGAALICICLYFPNPVSTRIFSDDNGAAHSRVPLMHLAMNMIVANPVMGVGSNNFVAVMNQYAGPEFRSDWSYNVHNQFLLVCSETGVIGLIAYLWIYVNLISRGWRLWRTRDPMCAPLALGIVACLVGLLTHMLVEGYPYGSVVQFVWLFAVLIASCELIQRREPVPRTDASPRSRLATGV